MLTFREALNVYQIYQSETSVIKIILLQTVRDLSFANWHSSVVYDFMTNKANCQPLVTFITFIAKKTPTKLEISGSCYQYTNLPTGKS